MESPAVHTYVAEEPPTTEEVQPKRKGLKSLPKGVIESKGRRPDAPIKYQARVGYKPAGESKVKQRGVGTFDTIDEAEAAVLAAEAKLSAGISPWAEPARVNQHSRGEVHSLRSLHHIIPNLPQVCRALVLAGTSSAA